MQLVIHDPWFAWLRHVSELLVRVDELLEPAQDEGAGGSNPVEPGGSG